MGFVSHPTESSSRGHCCLFTSKFYINNITFFLIFCSCFPLWISWAYEENVKIGKLWVIFIIMIYPTQEIATTVFIKINKIDIFSSFKRKAKSSTIKINLTWYLFGIWICLSYVPFLVLLKKTTNKKNTTQKHTHTHTQKPNSIAFRRTGVKEAYTHAIQPKITLATGHGKAWNNCSRALPHVGVLDNCLLQR